MKTAGTSEGFFEETEIINGSYRDNLRSALFWTGHSKSRKPSDLVPSLPPLQLSEAMVDQKVAPLLCLIAL